MELRTVGAVNSSVLSAKSTVISNKSASQMTSRGHSDSSGFSAFAREIIRAAAENKKSLLSERAALDFKPENDHEIPTMSSDEIKAAIDEIVKNAAESHAKEVESAKTDAAQSTASDPVDPVQTNGEKTEQKTMAEWVKEQTEKLDKFLAEREYDKKHDQKLIDIRTKMRQGKTLSPTEQQYLAAKDPEGYSSFQKINSARQMFKCSLRSCRTKDDVNSMRLANALTALSEYRKATRKGGSGDDIVALNAAFENELRDFSQSSGYRKLPTVAECNKFDRDIAKARRYEQEKRLEKRRLAAEKAKKYKKKKKAIKTPGDGKRTVAQVLADPTSKKVIASRAKQTYCTCSLSYDITRRMNSKA